MRTKIFFISLILLTMFWFNPCYLTDTASIEVELITTATYIIDGDSFEATWHEIRLADIDAPEFDETGYQDTKDLLISLIEDKRIYLDIDDDEPLDVYDRLVCLAYVKHNATHLKNVNKAMLGNPYVDESDYPNEFDPATWTLYVTINEAISDYQYLFEDNEVRMIYPSEEALKPLGCSAAMVSDWTASAFIYTKLEEVTEGLDTDDSFVNQTTGRPLGTPDIGIISFGGPKVNPVVLYAENNTTPAEDRAPIKFHDEGGIFHFQYDNGTYIPGAELPVSVINENEDMFVIEVYLDGDGRYIMLCYGFGWKGTYAAGKYFDTEIYPDLESYPYSWIIIKWEDANGNGFVNTLEDGDLYTVIATGN